MMRVTFRRHWGEGGIISADVKQLTLSEGIGLFTAPTTVTTHPREVDKMPDGNDAFTLGSDTTCTDRQPDEAPQREWTRINEAWAEQRPAIVETASLIRHPADAGNGLATSQASQRKSHLARLVDAVQKSRRLQAIEASRHILHVVQGERG
jgi:hypothetical protein